jgi:hypothetical protein
LPSELLRSAIFGLAALRAPRVGAVRRFSEALITHAATQKVGREVPEFRKFRQLTREFLGTNAEICRLRPLEEEAETKLKKNGRSDLARDHARSRTALAGGVPG